MESPARRLEPGPIPNVRKKAVPNKGATLAMVERKRSFDASTEASHFL